MTAGGWCAHRFDLQRSWDALLDGVVQHESDVGAWAQSLGVRDGQRFLLDPKGFPDVRVNSFLASARMRNLAETTLARNCWTRGGLDTNLVIDLVSFNVHALRVHCQGSLRR
jgi:hypothetical protein